MFLAPSFSLPFLVRFLVSVFSVCVGLSHRNYSSCFSLNSHGHQKDSTKTVVTDTVATPILWIVFFKGFEVFVGFFLFFSSPPRQWNWDPFHKFICWALVLVTRNKSIASYLKDVIRTLWTLFETKQAEKLGAYPGKKWRRRDGSNSTQ